MPCKTSTRKMDSRWQRNTQELISDADETLGLSTVNQPERCVDRSIGKIHALRRNREMADFRAVIPFVRGLPRDNPCPLDESGSLSGFTTAAFLPGEFSL